MSRCDICGRDGCPRSMGDAADDAERDGLREEVARLRAESNERGAIAAASDAEAETLEAKLGQAVAALRDAVKHCRQCNGIGKYWPHCDACADSTCDHECPPQRLCGVCAEWRAILADPDSSAAGEAHAEVEELIDIWLRLRVFICPHETDNGLMCAECGDEQSKLANELESISAAIDARRRRGEVAK